MLEISNPIFLKYERTRKRTRGVYPPGKCRPSLRIRTLSRFCSTSSNLATPRLMSSSRASISEGSVDLFVPLKGCCWRPSNCVGASAGSCYERQPAVGLVQDFAIAARTSFRYLLFLAGVQFSYAAGDGCSDAGCSEAVLTENRCCEPADLN